ncbi:MAG: hypothetical protein ACLFTH_00130 [Candidatus Woesearchaeota archaeon]
MTMNKDWGKKASTISLAAVISIIMALLIAGGIYSGLSNIYSGEKTDNSDRIEKFKKIIYEVRYDESSNSKKDYSLFVEPYEMYLFYSTGNDPIYLKSTVEDKEKYLRIERPDYTSECNNSACICYCDEGPFWEEGEDEDGDFILKSNPRLTFSENKDTSGYLCHGMTCEDVEPSSTIFFNSRGFDNDYTESVIDRYESYRDDDGDSTIEKRLFYATPFDIVILLSYPGRIILEKNVKEEVGESFLSVKPLWVKFLRIFSSVKYDEAAQSEDTLEALTQRFSWDGGIAIGGSGTPKSERDVKNHKMRGVEMTLTFQATLVNNGIAICPAETCAFEKAIDHYSDQPSRLQAINIRKKAIENYEGFIKISFTNCLHHAQDSSDYKGCFLDFETRTENLFQHLKEQVPVPYESIGAHTEVVLEKPRVGEDKYTNISVKKTSEPKKMFFEHQIPMPYPQITKDENKDQPIYSSLNYEDASSPLIINDIVVKDDSTADVLNEKHLIIKGKKGKAYNVGIVKPRGKTTTMYFKQVAQNITRSEDQKEYESYDASDN